MRMEDGRIPKRALLGTWEGTRPRGRPTKRWEDDVAEAVSYTHLDVYKRQGLHHILQVMLNMM